MDGAGRREIAVATSALMKEYDVAIWAHHGMFCSGEDFESYNSGLMHTVREIRGNPCKDAVHETG